MSFPISRGAPSGAALDPSAQTDTAGSPSGPTAPSGQAGWLERSQLQSQSQSHPHSLALPLQQALYFTGDVPLRAYLASDQATTVRRELDAALNRLMDTLAPVDPHRRLSPAVDQLQHSMQRDDDRLAQMLGHGKRWLTGLLRLLETHPHVDVSDRRWACDLLVDNLQAERCAPATAFGLALNGLRDRLPGGADARGFRVLLQQRVLHAMLDQWPQETGARKMSAQQRVKALMVGFGVQTEAPGSKSTGSAFSVEQLNRAAASIEERLQNQTFPVAHDMLLRLEACYEGAAKVPLPRADLLSTAEEACVQAALVMLQTVIGVNLQPFLTTRDPGGRLHWHLQTASHLASCITAALPELSTTSPHLPAPAPLGEADTSSEDELVPLSSPSNASTSSSSVSSEASPVLQARQPAPQERGSGATGTFSAGTGGASSRGPT